MQDKIVYIHILKNSSNFFIDFVNITIDVTNVIGRGNNLVFKGTFNSIPCVVKRVIKPVGSDMSEMIAKGKREIDIWIELSNSPMQNIPIVRCFGSEENLDFWSVILIFFNFLYFFSVKLLKFVDAIQVHGMRRI